MAAKERIGFIGTGFMGHGMAKNIVEGGQPLSVLANRNRAPVDDLITRGAVEATSPKALAEASDIVFLCLPGSPQVEQVIRGENGLAAGLAHGSVIVDCSTADPTSTLALAAELAPSGIAYADAPIGRTPVEAWAGTLDAMVGADASTFARIEPVIDLWAGKIVHIGAVGDGHKMKLINNFLSMGYGAIYAEAIALAAKSGITPQTFDSVIRGGRMDCGFYQTFMGKLIDGNPESHKFTLTNALKDMRYLEALANAQGVANPVGNAIKNSYATAVNDGGDGPADYVPNLVDHIARRNGAKLT